MIPKIIHHIWPGFDPFRAKFHKWRMSWMEHNPDYTMMFWNLSNFPYGDIDPLSQKLLKSDLCMIGKAELCKYEILALFGGIYVDTDMECLKNFNPLLNTSSFVGRGYKPDNICNAIMACEPGSPLFTKISAIVRQSCIDEWELVNTNEHGKLLTAKGGMRTVGKIMEAEAETVHDTMTFFPFWCLDGEDKRRGPFPNSYAVHHWNGMTKEGWTNADYSKNRASRLVV